MNSSLMMAIYTTVLLLAGFQSGYHKDFIMMLMMLIAGISLWLLFYYKDARRVESEGGFKMRFASGRKEE